MILVYCTFNLQSAIRELGAETHAGWHSEGARRGRLRRWREPEEGHFQHDLSAGVAGLAVTLILTWAFARNEYLLAATLTNFKAHSRLGFPNMWPRPARPGHHGRLLGVHTDTGPDRLQPRAAA